ncbi:methyltransferase domain-containing protein [Streptomyces phyllanthi]|uniref:Methyltransferase domain-containing protein n=1 Tax=Streptomyces phyllanthi TaxID=1803180 RepID=A0A5N8W2S0_9ACTN|nr:methyltransferase domain-containing protein [Streptomyces phyllanthi]MPY41791.1 methyltransferase domain-containing protein [Streptomyces phyllanthi]
MADALPDGLEDKLVSALQPIRGFVLAQSLYQFLETGAHEVLASAGTLTVARLARSCDLDEDRLRGFLQYLSNEDFVELTAEDEVTLSAKGAEIAVFRPWYTLLVGGYTGAMVDLGRALADRGVYASRDAAQVGVGSCGISRFDALPMAERLLERIPGGVRTVVDLGCGDGRYLVELCERIPGLRGVGVELGEQSVANARKLVRERDLTDRIDIRMGTATELPDLGDLPEPLCFITAFVLQEILEQAGREAIVDLLTRGFQRHPDASWIVVEVDHRPADEKVMLHGLGLGYYNPYYLIHHITRQQLETRQFWEDLFAEAGLHVTGPETPDAAYDSLGLKLAYLLRAAPGTPEQAART